MSLYEKLVNKEEKLALVGLGYVGMPIAVAFSKKVDKMKKKLILFITQVFFYIYS